MFKKISAALALITSVSTLVSASINFDAHNKTSIMQEIAALEVAVPAAPAPERAAGKSDKEWTIMVFVNGKNNLEEYALTDMNEMEMVGSSDKVNIVTEVGRIAGYDTTDGDWISTHRYLVQKDSDMTKVASPVLQDLGKTDMGDYNSVIAFVNWAKTNYPARKYMLIIWNHGSGWDKSVEAGVTKGISYDDETDNHITTPQMGQIFKAVGKIDVYGSDACLMQMPEVVYEIKDNVSYVVGSEETEPGDGYTYNDFLAPVIAKPAMTPEELGKVAVAAYSDHYQKVKQTYTQSLVNTSAMVQFAAVMSDFATAMINSNDKATVKASIAKAQAYEVSDNHDIAHFATLMAAASKDANVKAKAQAVANYVKNNLVVYSRQYGLNGSTGIAGYMPGYYYNSDYNNLAWASATKWDEFIAWYLKK